MATEPVLPINGNYGAVSHSSSQPANLANGTGSEQSPAPTTGKDEVGWYFVEQYYTTMSRKPEQVHLFYNKRSQFVYGVEAEKVPVSVGQKAINERIAELEIEDCKVRVTNVDSQESGKSIVLQVIGEMSVKGQPHRKFAQTFVLAEQPNGYFVLNDIFRYIADEPDEEEDLEPAGDDSAAAPVQTQEGLKALTSSDDVEEQARDVEVVDKKLEEVAAEAPNTEAAPVEEPVVAEAAPVEHPAEDDTGDEVEATKSVDATLEPEKPKDPEPTPAPTPAPIAQAAPPKEIPAPAPAPAKPAAPKTWASMLAGSKAPPAVPVVPNVPVATPAAQPRPSPATATATQAPAAATPAAALATSTDSEVSASPGGWQTAGQDHGKKQNRNQPAGVVDGYIKNVTAQVDAAALKQHLSEFGKLVYFDVSRPKNYAFIEYETPAGYGAAVAANPHKVNGEDIVIEERRPRTNTYNNNFRGGARGGRGNGSAPAGRGGFPARGRGGPANRPRGGVQDV